MGKAYITLKAGDHIKLRGFKDIVSFINRNEVSRELLSGKAIFKPDSLANIEKMVSDILFEKTDSIAESEAISN